MTTKRVQFDDILYEIGDFGRYQVLLLFFVAVKDSMGAWQNMYFQFSNADYKWHCANHSALGNVSESSSCDSECRTVIFHKGFNSIVTEWDLICNNAYVVQLTVTIQLIGVLIGAAVYGQLADVYGRRWTFLSSVLLGAVSQILVGTSTDVIWFIVWRSINGIASGGSLGISYVYTGEFIGPKWRSLLFGAGWWDYGTCLLALIAWGVQDWRLLAYVTGTCGFILVPMIIWMVPESPRWLIQTGREEEAKQAIKFIAKFNRRQLPDSAVLRALFDTVSEEANDKRYSYKDLFTTSSSMTKNTSVLILIWFSMAEIYYAINAAVPSFSGNVYLNVVYSAITMVPVQLLSVVAFRRYRRKVCFVVYSSITCVSLFGVAALEFLNIRQYPYLTLFLALVGKSFGGSMWLLTGMITLEIYPTLIRTIGFGAGNAMCRIGAAIAPQILLLGFLVHASIPYIVHGSLILISTLACVIVLPETLNKPLPEMDGDVQGTGNEIVELRRLSGRGSGSRTRRDSEDAAMFQPRV